MRTEFSLFSSHIESKKSQTNEQIIDINNRCTRQEEIKQWQ